MSKLILIRHGESLWNLQNKFTGWIDVPLSEKGVKEAQKAAKKLASVPIDLAYTSKQVRAQQTLMIVLNQQQKTIMFLGGKKDWYRHTVKKITDQLPVMVSEKLNERYYGDLQGLNKDDARKRWGDEKVHLWRRSYNVAPPNGESLKDVCKRTIPYLKKEILPRLKENKNVIIAAHGNSLRAIMKYLEHISDEDIPHLELKTGTPIMYEYKRGKLYKGTTVFDLF